MKRQETQKQQVRKQLIEGAGITPMHALNRFGCMRLAVVINRLRNDGMNIKTHMMNHDGRTFAYYSLVKPKNR